LEHTDLGTMPPTSLFEKLLDLLLPFRKMLNPVRFDRSRKLI